MSFFSWLSGRSGTEKQASGKIAADSDSSALGREKSSAPGGLKPLSGDTRGGPQKSNRHARRELLYIAVREAMIRAGVLSGSYKFKVLSLDPRGEQFMVMMDLAHEFGTQTERLAEIEVMIAQSAKSRYNIRVTAVYWRFNEMVSVAQPADATSAINRPAAVQHAEAVPAQARVAQPAPRYEPIQDDEVAAFKQALAAASAEGLPASESSKIGRSTPRSYTLLTGFEDTEMPESPALVPALSATQYGDLN